MYKIHGVKENIIAHSPITIAKYTVWDCHRLNIVVSSGMGGVMLHHYKCCVCFHTRALFY